MKTEILIIDDHMSLHDPFVRSIRKNRPEAVVTVLDDAGKGVEYISNDLRKKVVVFLDCRFDSGIQGVDALRRIREKTSLVYIVMMSANPLSQMEEETLKAMINHRGIFFISNTEMDKALELIEKIEYLMDSKVDCVLEQWIMDRDDIVSNEPYIIVGGVEYSLRDILDEIRLQTPFGKEVEKKMVRLAVHLLQNKKASLKWSKMCLSLITTVAPKRHGVFFRIVPIGFVKRLAKKV